MCVCVDGWMGECMYVASGGRGRCGIGAPMIADDLLFGSSRLLHGIISETLHGLITGGFTARLCAGLML